MSNSVFRFESGLEIQPELLTKTVRIVANESDVRACLARMVLESGRHAEVYTDAIELVSYRPNHGIVLCHESKDCSALKVCKTLEKNLLWLPVIGFGARVSAERIVAGIKAGALDFLVGRISPETIREKIDNCTLEANVVFELWRNRAHARWVIDKLSERELEILHFLVAGLTSKEMARELDISPRTVEVHRLKMMEKLGANSIAQAVRLKLISENS